MPWLDHGIHAVLVPLDGPWLKALSRHGLQDQVLQ
jgi:hypothetical protein